MDVLPLQLEHAARVEKLPDHHNDPFDRLLISQALAEKMAIITSDARFASYEVGVVGEGAWSN